MCLCLWLCIIVVHCSDNIPSDPPDDLHMLHDFTGTESSSSPSLTNQLQCVVWLSHLAASMSVFSHTCILSYWLLCLSACVCHSGKESVCSANIQRCQSGSSLGFHPTELRRSVAFTLCREFLKLLLQIQFYSLWWLTVQHASIVSDFDAWLVTDSYKTSVT